jgi:hypothetical protein
VIIMQDEELLAELSALWAALDPVDPVLLEQARMAFGWRTIDADLAELSYDSLADREVLAGVRDGGQWGSGPRLLGFGTEQSGADDDALAVEIEVSSEHGRTTLIGQLMPPAPAVVRVQRFERAGSAHEGPAAVAADDLGRFRFESMPIGPVRLHIETGARIIHTSWVSYSSAS